MCRFNKSIKTDPLEVICSSADLLTRHCLFHCERISHFCHENSLFLEKNDTGHRFPVISLLKNSLVLSLFLHEIIYHEKWLRELMPFRNMFKPSMSSKLLSIHIVYLNWLFLSIISSEIYCISEQDITRVRCYHAFLSHGYEYAFRCKAF